MVHRQAGHFKVDDLVPEAEAFNKVDKGSQSDVCAGV